MYDFFVQVDIIDGKTSESELDFSLEYDMQRNKDSTMIERKICENLTVARREPEGKDNDSINTVNSLNADANKMVPLGKLFFSVLLNKKNIYEYFYI